MMDHRTASFAASTANRHFYGGGLLSKPVSQAVLDWSFGMGSLGSHQATVACGRAFAETDFRQVLAGIKVPALIIHGADDKTVPIKNSGDLMSQHLPHAIYITYDRAPPRLVHHREGQIQSRPD